MSPCSEQGKLPAAKAFRLAERDKHMSEQEKPKSFMQELDQWTDATILAPLLWTNEEGETEEVSEHTLKQVKYAIREKVLESYRNGCKAGAGHVRREFRGREAGQMVAAPAVQR